MAIRKIVLTVLLLPAITVLAQELHKPLPPIAPKDYAECEALDRAWQPILKKLDEVAWACFRKNVFKEFATELMTPIVCLPVARQEHQAVQQHRSQMDACNDGVRQHKQAEQERERAQDKERAQAEAAKKKADQERHERMKQMQRESEEMQRSAVESERQRDNAIRRHLEEQQRAAADAERKQHEASQRAVNDAMRDLFTAKERAEVYKNKATSTGKPRVELTAGEQRSLDAIRQQTDADSLRPRYVPIASAAPAVMDASSLTGAVADLLGAEFQAVLKWGLNQTEAGGYAVQMFETGEEYDAKYRSFLSSAEYVRSVADGTATYGEHVSAVKGTTGVLSGFAFAGNPAIAIQLGRVVGGVSAGHQAGFQQLELLLASTERPLSASEMANVSDPRRIIQAVFGPFLPLGRIQHLERIANEGARVYDSHNRGFLQVFGR